MKNLQAHYLDLIDAALGEANQCHTLLLADEPQRRGDIYITRSETDTRAFAVLRYEFDSDRFRIGLKLTDDNGAGPFTWQFDYTQGLEQLFKNLQLALTANRLAAPARKRAS